MDIVISAATHRSGSTLLQRMFNARPGTLVWGEHGGVVSDFVSILEKVRHFSVHSEGEKEQFFGSPDRPDSWTANMTPDPPYVERATQAALRAFCRMLYDQYRHTHDRIGFKEVRYGKAELELLRSCYPEALLVLVVRNPVHVWKSESGYWDSPEQFAEIWNAHALEYATLAEQQDGRVHLFRYEDVAGRRPETMALLSELTGVAQARLARILEAKLNSTSKDIPEEMARMLKLLCREGMETYGYA